MDFTQPLYIIILALLSNSQGPILKEYQTGVIMQDARVRETQKKPEEEYIMKLSTEDRYLLLVGYSTLHRLPLGLLKLLYCFICDYAQYQGKVLPRSFFGYNLSQFNFTGCRFTHTYLENVMLDEAILDNTTCDYTEQYRRNNYHTCEDIYYEKGSSSSYHPSWYIYKENFRSSLTSIREVYPTVSSTQKAVLLQAASFLACSPFFFEKREDDFYIMLEYYAAKLWKVKQEGRGDSQKLICVTEDRISYHCRQCCWTTEYQEGHHSTSQLMLHHDFNKYLTEFIRGLQRNKCIANFIRYFLHYMNTILQSIQGLKKAYPYIASRSLKKEACQIAHLLSISYQYGERDLFEHYTTCQKRLVTLKEKLMHTEAEKYLHYDSARVYTLLT